VDGVAERLAAHHSRTSQSQIKTAASALHV